MDFKEYQEQASGTFKPAIGLNGTQSRTLNWILGLGNEVGELQGELKHIIFHDEPYDSMKVAKEVGDVLWYLAALCTTLDLPLDVCAELNLMKLRHRHGGSRYSAEGSGERHRREDAFEDTETYKDLKRRVKRHDSGQNK